jgi:hypothetical protein
LSAVVGLKSVHVAKFRQAFPDHTQDLPEAAADGFKGSLEAVTDHANKLKRLKLGLPAFQPPPPPTPVDLYEAPDGFRGTFDEVAAHEAQLGHTFCARTGAVIGHPAAPTVLSALEPLELGQFALAFHALGVDVASELQGCPDAWLLEKVGFNAAHLLKFRDAVPDGTDALTETASDGYKGSAFLVRCALQPMEVGPGEACGVRGVV